MNLSPQPLVSVVIPTYNRADFIQRAIASVCSQSYRNLEVLVVDDCSQDNTSEIVREAADRDSRISYHRHSSNLGGSAARNTGIKQAAGEYIAFLDSDDVWLSQKLELQLKEIAKQKCETARCPKGYRSAYGGQMRLKPFSHCSDCRGCDCQRVVSYTKFQKSSRVFYFPSVLPRRGKKDNETMADYFWQGGGEILTSTLLVSRSLATKYLFKAGLPKHQDLDFVLRLGYTNAKFVFVPQVLTIWHNESRSDRISRSPNYQLSQDWIASYQNQISERAYKGFILKEVVPLMLLDKENKSAGMNLLMKGFWQRNVPLDYFLVLIIKQFVSADLQQSLKRLLLKTKISNN